MPVSPDTELLPPPYCLGAPVKYDRWRRLQAQALVAAADSPRRFVFQSMPTGCLTGDTLIQVNRNGCSRCVTLSEELYRETFPANTPRRVDVASRTRSYNGVRVGLHPFAAVAHRGVRPTWGLVLVDGKALRGTPDHPVLTVSGFLPLCELRPGMRVLCDTSSPQRTDQRAPKKFYRMVQGLFFHPFAGSTWGRPEEGRLFRVALHRLVAEAGLNGMTVEQFVKVCRTDEARAATLTFLDPGEFVVHHLNNNHLDNAPGNLQVITHAAHAGLHQKSGRNFNQGVPRALEVRTCAPTGRDEEVFDVVGCGYENFVANDIIVHNSGKSLIYVVQGKLSGRTCILTSTKGLQTQLMGDFGGAPTGLVDIRGMNSYPCLAAESEFGVTGSGAVPRSHSRSRSPSAVTGCDDGPCRAGLKCSLKEAGCLYYDAYREAAAADLVVTNYSYWMHINRWGEGIGPEKFRLLVLDEGHDAADHLSDFLAIDLDPYEIESVMRARPLQPGATIDDWRDWAEFRTGQLEERLGVVQADIRARREAGQRIDHSMIRETAAVRRTLGKVKSLATAKGSWVVEQRGKKYRFDPVWPAEYAEQFLFRGVEKVVIFSATIRPKTAGILGIRDGTYDFNEYPSSFPIKRRPVYHIPTVQIKHTTTADNLLKWVRRMDQIIDRRLDRKGLIHTVSYERRNFLMQHSEHAALMYSNDSTNTRQVVERFKAAPSPAILVSPSITTGFDFSGDTCRYIILAKVPFPDARALIEQARVKADSDYHMYTTALTVVQALGRGMRAEDDWMEGFIVDDNWLWFFGKYNHFFPKWFKESCSWPRVIPPAPEIETGP